MSTLHRVLVVGLGKRGLHHATFFKANPRFELIGISSRDSTRLQNALSKLGKVPSSGDARSLALSARPDIFCFCTPPNVRRDIDRVRETRRAHERRTFCDARRHPRGGREGRSEPPASLRCPLSHGEG